MPDQLHITPNQTRQGELTSFKANKRPYGTPQLTEYGQFQKMTGASGGITGNPGGVDCSDPANFDNPACSSG